MIYVFLADGFEEVEAFTVIDYLRRCCELEVISVGVYSKQVTGAHNIVTICDIDISQVNMKKTQMIILPGGMPGTINLENSELMQNIIYKSSKQNCYIGAICAAPIILAHNFMLDNKKATCFPDFKSELVNSVYMDEPVVVDGNIITACSAGVANEFAFELIKQLLGKDKSREIRDVVKWKKY